MSTRPPHHHLPMFQVPERPSDWAKIAAVVIPIAGAAYVGYYRLGQIEEAQAKTEAQQYQSSTAITTMQETLRSIKESLGEIKQDVRGLNAKVDSLRK